MPKPEAFSCRIYGILPRPKKDGGQEILMTRSIFKGKEFVNYPGGGVHLGEAPAAALIREFKEETGLDISLTRVLYASESCHVSTQIPWQLVSIYWQVEAVSGELRLGGNNDDVAATFWSDLKALPVHEMFPSDIEFSRLLPKLL